MPQKYVVYLNRKALFFNNSEGFQLDNPKLTCFKGKGKETVLTTFTWLINQKEDHAVAYLSDVDFPTGIKLLKENLIFIQAAGGLVSEPTGKILCIHRLGFWDFPKGKVDPGESLPDAASREVSEETGIPLLQPGAELCRTWHCYELKGKFVLKETVWYPFMANQEFLLNPQTEEHISEAIWLDPVDFQLLKDQTYPAIVDVFNVWTAWRKSQMV
jgi:8-oxo-dGTP pyrophosphatase MutT (NUDIX family)